MTKSFRDDDMLIYYFTGTGNTLKAALDFAKMEPDTKLIRITEDTMGDVLNYSCNRSD